MKKITVHLKSQSQPIEYSNVKNTYEKGSFFCIYLESGDVQKYPIADIFRVTEPYKSSFEDKVKELKNNKDEIYKRMEEQAEDKETQSYYNNPENTPMAEEDINKKAYKEILQCYEKAIIAAIDAGKDGEVVMKDPFIIDRVYENLISKGYEEMVRIENGVIIYKKGNCEFSSSI